MARGADVNASSSFGTPLVGASTKGSAVLVELLVAKGADPNAVHADATPLLLAVKKNCLPCVEALVGAGADVNWRNSVGQTALHLARSIGYSEIDAYLVDHGVVPPTPAPVSPRLATADVARGEKLFGFSCRGCHAIEAGGDAQTGPPLWSVIGRERASHPATTYSAALLDWDGNWTFEDLNVFLTAPMAARPGVNMPYAGMPDEIDRADVIAYMRTQSDAPVPLP